MLALAAEVIFVSSANVTHDTHESIPSSHSIHASNLFTFQGLTKRCWGWRGWQEETYTTSNNQDGKVRSECMKCCTCFVPVSRVGGSGCLCFWFPRYLEAIGVLTSQWLGHWFPKSPVGREFVAPGLSHQLVTCLPSWFPFRAALSACFNLTASFSLVGCCAKLTHGGKAQARHFSNVCRCCSAYSKHCNLRRARLLAEMRSRLWQWAFASKLRACARATHNAFCSCNNLVGKLLKWPSSTSWTITTCAK